MKHSLNIANIANEAHDLCRMHFPGLAASDSLGIMRNVWFTGSRIWALLYADLPRPAEGSDWDIFVVGDDAARHVASVLNLRASPACPTREKRHGAQRTISLDHVPRLVPHPTQAFGAYGEGYSYATPSGEIDLWVSTPGDVFDELRTYPGTSHAHCRAAFSFVNGLIVLPNELAIHTPTELEPLEF